MQSAHTSFSLIRNHNFFSPDFFRSDLGEQESGTIWCKLLPFSSLLFFAAQSSRGRRKTKVLNFFFFLLLFGQYQCVCVPNWGVPTRISSFFSLAPPFYCHLLFPPSFFRVKEKRKKKQVHIKKTLAKRQCKFNCTGIPFEHFSCQHFILISYTGRLW